MIAGKDITELADPVTGAVVAHYECSPFGKLLVSSGPLAGANPYRFSSKEHDSETALVYYGYRYYSPELGRWINRDPIGERGGLNLGTICGNSPVNGIDPLGLAESSESCGECCCCVRDLYWSAINRYESADLTVIGHEISMTAKIEKKRKISPADGGACKFEWWEITNEPAAEWILQGVLPNVERDLFYLNSSYFSDWTVRYADIPCPGSGGADSFDKPKANTTRHYQVVNMRIRVKVTSTCSSCPGSREIVFKQHLELTPKQGLWKKSWSLPEPMLRGNDNPPGPFPYP
jgi:RHS repeat-associated protein